MPGTFSQIYILVVFAVKGRENLISNAWKTDLHKYIAGIPLLNWSEQYGDLRIAHFLGIHSLQLLPLIGFYVAKSKSQMLLISFAYFMAVMFVFVLALRGIPLLK